MIVVYRTQHRAEKTKTGVWGVRLEPPASGARLMGLMWEPINVVFAIWIREEQP